MKAGLQPRVHACLRTNLYNTSYPTVDACLRTFLMHTRPLKAHAHLSHFFQRIKAGRQVHGDEMRKLSMPADWYYF